MVFIFECYSSLILLILNSVQYYRQARQKALHIIYPDISELDDDEPRAKGGSLNYPRPFSEPPSPAASRHTTPTSSRHGSDDEDEVDDEKEVSFM